MSEDKTIGAEQGNPQGASSAETENTGAQQAQTIPYARFVEVNNKLKEATAELERQRAERQAADDKRLADDQKWQELAEQRAQKIAELEPLAQQAQAAQEALQATVTARVARLPDDVRDMVPDYEDPRKTLAWLDANEPRLLKPTAPGTDAGVRGDSGGSAQLTDTERYIAGKLGVTPEDFAAEKQRTQKRP